MTNTPQFYQIVPRTAGLERLDVSGVFDDWSTVRELVQHDLAALDQTIFGAAPAVRVRPGSNRGGEAHLFLYRVYEPAMGSGIDPVVVGILIRPVAAASADHFSISGDIAGESLGDILFEVEPREVIGWMAMTEAARDITSVLTRQVATVISALRDMSRRE